MGLIAEVEGVFDVLRYIYEYLPVAIRLLIFASFGGMVYIAVLKHFGG